MTNEAQAKVEIGVAPDAREVFGRNYRKWEDLVEQLRSANEVKKQAEAEAKALNDKIKELWADVGAKTVLYDNCKVTLVMSSNSHISKERLLELGVSATVIRDATAVKPYQYVLVTEPKR